MISDGHCIDTQKRPRKTWREVLSESAPLLVPVAHDALSAKVVEQAGYPVYQIGGFALVGSRFGNPLGVPSAKAA